MSLVRPGLRKNQNGNNNFVQADGQTIDVVSGDFSTLLMIGAAANGSQTDQAIFLTFSDGTSLRWTQSFTDWANGDGSENNSPPSAAELEATNETLVATTTWVNQVGNNRSDYNRFVYGYSFDIPAGKTLKSITLPTNRNVGILGMALIPLIEPSSAPQNLAATPTNVNDLSVSWSVPEDVYGGASVTYVVTLTQNGVPDQTVTTTDLTATFEGLLLGAPYTVTVQPQTSYGDGESATLTQTYPIP